MVATWRKQPGRGTRAVPVKTVYNPPADKPSKYTQPKKKKKP